ncbi:insulin-related peptide 2-like [Trichoplusia ni]|uniref:Insulin-related peptide 2-like n=1 Tax=Trichoplusia ni TaxID=7111 RepID=A0A7E5VYN5_TRINI|nr:insulin-related peptide 2-like [Trichoplusia ni]
MMKLVVVVVAVVACAWLSAAQSGVSVYCGRQLSERLSSLCWGEPEQKRGWWVPPAGALAGVRGKRGLVDECCDKPCSIEELLTYCF